MKYQFKTKFNDDSSNVHYDDFVQLKSMAEEAILSISGISITHYKVSFNKQFSTVSAKIDDNVYTITLIFYSESRNFNISFSFKQQEDPVFLCCVLNFTDLGLIDLLPFKDQAPLVIHLCFDEELYFKKYNVVYRYAWINNKESILDKTLASCVDFIFDLENKIVNYEIVFNGHLKDSDPANFFNIHRFDMTTLDIKKESLFYSLLFYIERSTSIYDLFTSLDIKSIFDKDNFNRSYHLFLETETIDSIQEKIDVLEMERI